MQDAADVHRKKLADLNEILREIASKPVVIDDAEFASKLEAVREKIDILADDAKSGAGGGDRTLKERIQDLHERLDNVRKLVDNSNELQGLAAVEIDKAATNVTLVEDTISLAQRALTVCSSQ